MWTDHTRGSRQLVRNTIIQEIRRLLHEHRVYSELDLLAATQSLLMLLSIVLFGLGRPESGDSSTSPPHLVDEPQLLVAVWDVKHKLAMTGLFLGQEAHHGPSHPSWCDWAFVSAKRRTIQGLHHLEWAWSVFFGYPVLTCFELGPLPAPAAKFLWQATNESKWKRLYGEWLWRWREGGGFKMAEFFTINPGGELDMRSEMWLAEADEFGMMLMAEVNAVVATLIFLPCVRIPPSPTPIMPTLLIYGASGYTGRLASHHAKSLGIDFIVAGRAESTEMMHFASELDVRYRVFDLSDPESIKIGLRGISVLLNCAGPFMRTAAPLIAACIQNVVHYLDISAELDSYKVAQKNGHEAKEANVMLMPGCGGSVVMLGCLAGKVVERVKNPSRIDLSLYVAGSMSRGSAISASENMAAECFQRLNGQLVKHDTTSIIELDFDNGQGTVANHPVTLPDLITVWKSTKVRNIRTFVHAAGDAFPTGDLTSMPDGPTEEQREATPYHAAVSVTAESGTDEDFITAIRRSKS
ncbi:hypothetical protein TruAng_004064 [Truncatella angustata]|nr:hypothetical protein TruAng_004064 [Truncatella angustata]